MTYPDDEVVNNLGSALLLADPEFSIKCEIRNVSGQASAKLVYEITEDAKPVLTVPWAELHEAAYEAFRSTDFQHLIMTLTLDKKKGWHVTIEHTDEADDIDKDESEEDREERQELYWQQVYDARQSFFDEHVGAAPENIFVLNNLWWQGGGLMDFPISKIPNVRIFATIGLTNPDVPSDVERVNVHRTERGNQITYESELKLKTPRYIPEEFAGYGYELLVLSAVEDDRYRALLQYLAEIEIVEDADTLGCTIESDGLTIEDAQLDDDVFADFIIYPSVGPIPASYELPNGIMHVLIATQITRDEMNFAMKNGRAELIKLLQKKGVGQLSIPDRASVV